MGITHLLEDFGTATVVPPTSFPEISEEAIEEERTELDERVSVYETRLRAKFLYNDKLISSLKTTEDFLTQQFEAMNASKE